MGRLKLKAVQCWAASTEILQESCSQGTWLIHPQNSLIPDLKMALPGTVFFSLDELLDHICRKAGYPPLIGKTVITTLVAGFIREVPGKYFSIKRFRPGYARAVATALIHYREQSPLRMQAEPRNTENSSMQIADFLKLHALYQEYLQSNRLYDKRRASQEIEILQYLAGTELVFWGFSTLTPLEEYFILGCIEAAKSSALIYSTLPILFPSAAGKDGSLHQFRQLCVERKFSGAANLPIESQEKNNRQQGLHLISAKDRREEVENALHWICNKLDEGAKPGDFQIYLADYTLYASYLQELFPAYLHPRKIEADWMQGIPYRLYPVTIFIKNLIQHSLAPNPYPLRREIFCSAYFRFSASLAGSEILDFAGPGLKEKLSNINGKTYSHPLDYYRVLSRQQELYRRGMITEGIDAAESFIQFAAGVDGEELKSRELLIAIMDFLCLKQAEKALYAFSARMTPGDFTKAIQNILALCGNSPADILGENQGQEFEQSLMDSLPGLFSRFHALWSSADSEVTKKFTLEQLGSRMLAFLDTENFSVPKKRKKLIRISSLDHLPWQPVSNVLILGLVEGDFPHQEELNFLNRTPREEEFFLTPDVVARDRAGFCQLLAQANRDIYCSAPLTREGKGLQTSSFLEYLKKHSESWRGVSTEVLRRPRTVKEQLLSLGFQADTGQKLPFLGQWQKKQPLYASRILDLLRCQGQRADNTKFTEFDGLLTHPQARKLNRELIRAKEHFLPGMLDLYAGCPLRFFFDHILNILPSWQEDYHPDHTPRGRFILSVLDSYTNLKTGGRETSELRRKLSLKIKKEAKRHFQGKQNLFDSQLIRQFQAGLEETEQKQGLFSAFLDWEAKLPDLFTPAQKKSSGTLEIDGITITIPLPRQDKTPEHKGTLVYNYTTGEIPSPINIEKGVNFLLPLQLYYLGLPPSRYPALGAGYFQVRSPGKLKKGGYLATNEIRSFRQAGVSPQKPLFSGQKGFGFLATPALKDFIQKTPLQVEFMLKSMQKGTYHLPLCTEQHQICVNCHFRRICRKDQLRLNGLRQHFRMSGDVPGEQSAYYLPGGKNL